MKALTTSSKAIVLIIFLFVFTLSSKAQTGKGKIEGIVMDKKTRTAMEFVTVVAKKNGIYCTSTVSNEFGKYELMGVDSGVYDLDVHFVGYNKYALKGIKLSLGSITSWNIELEPGWYGNGYLTTMVTCTNCIITDTACLPDIPSPEFNFKNAHGKFIIKDSTEVNPESNSLQTLIGNVIEDSKGIKIKRATLVLKKGNISIASSKSNRKGKYSFVDIPPGNYTLEVNSEGYLKYKCYNLCINPNQSLIHTVRVEEVGYSFNYYCRLGGCRLGLNRFISEDSTDKTFYTKDILRLR